MRRIAYALYVLVLALLMLRMPIAGFPDNLDGSWQALLQHDWNQRVRAGVGSVFTFGPSGFLLGTKMVFMLEGAWTRYVCALATAVVVALALTSLAPRMPTRAWCVAYLLCVLVVAPISYGNEVFACNLALGVLVLCRLTGADPPRARRLAGGAPGAWVLYIVACVVFVLTATTKFTYFVQASGQVAVVCAVLLLHRRVLAAAGAGAVFVIVFALVWLALGQSLRDVPAFLRGSVEIASGYNEAMSHRGSPLELWLALAVLALHGLLALSVLLACRARAAPAGIVGMVLLGIFLVWKGGFVRHDSSHALLLFGMGALTPFYVLLAHPQPLRLPARVLAAAAVFLSLGQHIHLCESNGWGATTALRTTQYNIDMLAPQRFQASLAAAFARHGALHALPQTRARVGDDEIDLMGHEQGVLFAAGLRVRHRPVFQSYSAYTPYLQNLNGAFFNSPDAPRYALAKLQAIDGHYPLTEDSAAWRALLERYFPVLCENGYLLLERQDRGASAATPQLLVQTEVSMGEWVTLAPSEHWHDLELDVAYSTRGKLAGLLFRPGQLLLDVRTTAEATFHIAPKLVRQRFLLDPCLIDSGDMVAAYVGEPSNRVLGFRVRPAPGKEEHYAPRVGVRVWQRPPAQHTPAPADLARMQAHVRALRFPTFAFLPERVEPTHGTRIIENGAADTWVMAHAPAALHFMWPGGKRVLHAEFQLAGGADEGEGQSDGVVFRVEAGTDTPRRVLFTRFLQPHAQQADRGVQSLRIEVDLPPATPLVLLTDPGPQGASTWDWSCWRAVRLEP